MTFTIEWDIANVVLRDLDPNFQGQTFQVAIVTSNGWKMQIFLLPSDMTYGICHRMALLLMLYVVNFAYIIKVRNFEMWISRKRWELLRKCSSKTFTEVDICHRMGALRMLYSITLTNIFKVKHLDIYICYTELHRQRMFTTDLPRLTQPSPWSCSCYVYLAFIHEKLIQTQAYIQIHKHKYTHRHIQTYAHTYTHTHTHTNTHTHIHTDPCQYVSS